MATGEVKELLDLLCDRSAPDSKRHDAAVTIRQANDGWLTGADGITRMVNDVPAEWSSPAVIKTLLEVASDPNEDLGIADEAAEALAEIWLDIGMKEPPAEVAKLVPHAVEVVRSMMANAT